jgi:hypothetical protein
MPTNDDTPIIPILAGAEDLTADEAASAANVARVDLVQIFDVSTRQCKSITVQALGEALGLTFA